MTKDDEADESMHGTRNSELGSCDATRRRCDEKTKKPNIAKKPSKRLFDHARAHAARAAVIS